MVFSIICEIVAGILLNKLGTSFFESLNLILNTIIGCFLLNEDPTFGKGVPALHADLPAIVSGVVPRRDELFVALHRF